MADKHIVKRLTNTHAREPLHSAEAARIDDVTARIRQPKRWMLRHPLRAARRQRGLAITFAAIGLVAAVLARHLR
jgi:hypothetical protein